MSRPLTLAAALALAGCSYSSFGGGADMGVTPGGSQDIGVARDLIAAGQIPVDGQFTAEGLFSEHDLPLDGPPCEDLLCPRAAATVHRPIEGDPKAMVQIGFATNIDMDSFERPDLDLAFLVDTSCSMSGAWLDVAKQAMADAVAQLGPNDRASLTEFGSRPRVLQRAVTTDADGRAKLLEEIERLNTDGSTDMESGMREAFAQIEARDGRSGRLMIFTDALPNFGLTDDSDFLRLVRAESMRGVGVTFLGINPMMGSELADQLSRVRGSNFYFLDEEGREDLFVDSFDFMVTPIAYDFEATLSSLVDVPVEPEVYGAPVDGDDVRIGASTLFLSQRRGGIAALFPDVPTPPANLATFQVSYLPVGGDARVETAITAGWDGGTFRDEADALGVWRMDALLHEYKALRAAAAACAGERTAADAQLLVAETATRMRAWAEADANPALEREAVLLEKLAENLLVEPTPCASPW
jgi:Ca-activated chloride channel family protein